MELISIYSLTNHSQKNWGILLVGKINCSSGKVRFLLAQINSKGIDKLEKLNREIGHDIKNEKVAVIVENLQITEI
jgi:lipopolysaccharide biosynthesis glycosyltransferase